MSPPWRHRSKRWNGGTRAFQDDKGSTPRDLHDRVPEGSMHMFSILAGYISSGRCVAETHIGSKHEPAPKAGAHAGSRTELGRIPVVQHAELRRVVSRAQQRGGLIKADDDDVLARIVSLRLQRAQEYGRLAQHARRVGDLRTTCCWCPVLRLKCICNSWILGNSSVVNTKSARHTTTIVSSAGFRKQTTDHTGRLRRG